MGFYFILISTPFHCVFDVQMREFALLNISKEITKANKVLRDIFFTIFLQK